jgi:hypothetical protein
LTKKPHGKNKKNPKKKSSASEFGWEFTQSAHSHHNEKNYEEFLKESYNYNDKLYEVHKEEIKPKKIVKNTANTFEEELIEAAKRALDR